MKLRENLTGLKPYIAGKLKEGAVKLASNENPLGASPKALDAMRDNLSKISLYPDSNCEALKNALARKYALPEDQFIIGNGSDEILLFIAGAYMEKGRNAVTSDATFSEYTFAVKLFDGEIKYAPMNDCRFQLDKISGLVDKSTQVIFLCNPNNPTGTYFTEKELVKLMDHVSRDVLVVLDEAYNEYSTAADYPSSIKLLGRYQNLLILRTFSKMYGLAGLRVGYGIGSKDIIADLLKTKEPFNVNLLAQLAATAAVSDDEFVSKAKKVNEEGKSYLYSELDAMGIPFWKTEANFIFMRIGIECNEAFKALMDLGITIRPMKVLGYDDAIRVTVGTREQNELFIKLLKKILGK